MKEENIGSMVAVIAVTNSDEKNLICALLAKRLGAKKVIAQGGYLCIAISASCC